MKTRRIIMKDTFKINNKQIGESNPTFIIAEIGQAHEGSLGMAHAYIDALSEAGADAVKFQTHIAECESTHDEPFRIKFSQQDKTRYDYWKRMEFSPQQWKDLADHANSKGLVFLSSAFSIEAFRLLNEIGLPAWKIGSGEFKTKELIDMVCKTRKPVLYSTGMSSWDEIDNTVSVFRSYDIPFVLLQCTSIYPTKLEDTGLNVLDEFRKRYDCLVGLSDHSGSIYPSLAAMAKGIDILEVHAIFDRKLFGPDAKASLTIEEIHILVQARDAFNIMKKKPVDKDEMAQRLSDMRGYFTKSIAPVSDLAAGTVLTETMLTLKKPGTGIPFEEKSNVIGKVLIRDVSAKCLLKWEDLKDE
jgi:N,N'-diacetyllegionaminate synthase